MSSKQAKNKDQAEQPPPDQKQGDNPNKANAQKRNPRQGGPKNAPVSTRPILESIDPVPPSATSVELQGITDARAPGTFHVGKIYLRVSCFDELCDLIVSMIDSTQGLVRARVDLPPLQGMGPFRKLKALRMLQLAVPDFLPPLIHAFGNYTTNEGLMKVAAIEQLIPMVIEGALEAYQNLPGARRLPGYNPVAPVVLYESSDYRTDFIDLVRVMHPHVFGEQRLILAAAVDVPVKMDMVNTSIAELRAFFNVGDRLQIDAGELQVVNAYLNLRDVPYGQAADPRFAPDFVTLDLMHGDRRPITQLADWLNVAIPEYQRVCYRALETIFSCSTFSPSNGGTSAQCVIGGPDADVDFTQARHYYALSPTSVAFGFMLMPAIEVEYKPAYVTYSVRSRYQHMMKVVDKYVVKNLTQG